VSVAAGPPACGKASLALERPEPTDARLEPHRVKDKYKLQQTFSVDPVYLRHADSGVATDFMVSLDSLAASKMENWLLLIPQGSPSLTF